MKRFPSSVIFLVIVVTVMVICGTADANTLSGAESSEYRSKRELNAEELLEACDPTQCDNECQSGSRGDGGRCQGGECKCRLYY